MALMADEPPSPRPLASGIDVPVEAWSVVRSPQLRDVPSRRGHAGGSETNSDGPVPPASSSSTRAPASSDSLAASTLPAVPAPTTT